MLRQWLKRRLKREHQKLLYQNSRASEGSLAGYFWNNEDVSARLSAMAVEVRLAAQRMTSDGHLSDSDSERQIEINRELRRLYDTTASRHLSSFDKAHAPGIGWKAWFEAHDHA